jgi:iron complex transport system substrate-binding protein
MLRRMFIMIVVLLFFYSVNFGFPIKMTDDRGNEIQLERAPQRIVSLVPSHTEILYALGLEKELVAVTKYCDYPPQAQEKPRIGGFADYSGK